MIVCVYVCVYVWVCAVKQSAHLVLDKFSLCKVLTYDLFVCAANESVTFEMAHGSFEQESVTTFYHCKTQQNLTFNASRTTLFTNDVRLQAFNLKNGSFTGEGEFHIGFWFA